jgi:ubiquinone biosynthesis protein COQ9
MIETKQKILDESLKIVPFEGWNDRMLKIAAKNAGISEFDLHRIFPTTRDLVEYFIEHLNQLMIAEMQKADLAKMKVRDKVKLGVRSRLEIMAPHKEAIRRLAAYFALPFNLAQASSAAFSTVDSIWKTAGDNSTDFNYYTKRGLLAWVYSSTLLFWLNDSSGGSADTWDFLERRIDEVMKIGKGINDIKQKFAG